jgi:hypothetical protein
MNYGWICHSHLFVNEWDDSSSPHLLSVSDYNIPARNKSLKKPSLNTGGQPPNLRLLSSAVAAKSIHPSSLHNKLVELTAVEETGGRKRERQEKEMPFLNVVLF